MGKKKSKKSFKQIKDKRLLKKSIADLPEKDRKNYWMKGFMRQQKLDK